jgi:putative methyltransferase (TIGR04325 family)
MFQAFASTYDPCEANSGRFIFGEQNSMNQLTLKLIRRFPWSLLSKNPAFGHVNTWIGVFPSWTAATAAIPKGSPAGFDQSAATEIFSSYPITLVRQSDYAVLLHLRNAVKAGMRVVDVGGSIGSACYIAQKYFPLPENFEWIVFDVPAVLEAGRAVARREGGKSHALRFVPDLNEAGSCDIFLSTGALQLIQDTLPELLRKLPQLPERVLINRIPVWDGEAIVTLNDTGFSLSPYHLFNRTQWVAEVEQLGYKLVDEWACPESNFFCIRFRPRTRLNAYRGFYFVRDA